MEIVPDGKNHICYTFFNLNMLLFFPHVRFQNIDSSLPVGSIFGIYKGQRGVAVDEGAFLQKGSNALVCSGYCLYS